jgi:tryptophan synthase alpha chain
VKKLDELSSGFLYAVSSSSTTGRDKNMTDVQGFLQRLRGLKLKNPILVGFGIKDKTSFKAACVHADGAIIGSAYIKALAGPGSISDNTRKFLTGIK